ncbi:MAG: ABC transporter substrate-binding protein, partial [Eggerthellaceae bacterium]|nr:ABC transporter substrate-binding protein [Eggerthellaceae bacterium]
DVQDAIAKVPEDQRIGVYYAEGPKGLKTEPENSPHFTTFKVGGAKNVADCENTKGAGMTEVSLENVITWNPDVIIAWSSEYRGGADELIRTDSDWASIAAVQNGRVYTIPCLPFTWGDRPPSVTRYIGMQWMANLLYPDVYDVDMVEVTKEYYKLFFSADLTDQEAKDILFIS